MTAPRLATPEAVAALESFLASPGHRTVEPLLRACREFVLAQARGWRQPALPFVDRCREILSEVFLILMEDLRIDRLPRPDSLLGYIALRLRRLTRPRRPWILAFGLDEDLPDAGRCGFTPLRLELVAEVVSAVRSTLVGEPHGETRRLEFLFIHVRPELGWASRLLAATDGASAPARYEADKKRHQAFHRNMRTRFEDLRHGDWREVAAWSPGERRHLAWRIIDLAAAEADRLGTEDHAALSRWREEPALAESDPPRVGELVSRGLQALADVHRPRPTRHSIPIPRSEVAEEAAPYGPEAGTDLFDLLFRGQRSACAGLSEPPAAAYGAPPQERSSAGPFDPVSRGRVGESDAALAFEAALSEVLSWSGSLFDRQGDDRVSVARSRPLYRSET